MNDCMQDDSHYGPLNVVVWELQHFAQPVALMCGAKLIMSLKIANVKGHEVTVISCLLTVISFVSWDVQLCPEHFILNKILCYLLFWNVLDCRHSTYRRRHTEIFTQRQKKGKWVLFLVLSPHLILSFKNSVVLCSIKVIVL